MRLIETLVRYVDRHVVCAGRDRAVRAVEELRWTVTSNQMLTACWMKWMESVGLWWSHGVCRYHT